MKKIYDMAVIGGGPAGYTAALYAVRAGLDTVVLEKLSAGGQVALSEQIDNYPGFENGINGFELGEKFQKTAEKFGAITELTEVERVSLRSDIKEIVTSDGIFFAKTVVIAVGAAPRRLGLPDEKLLMGKGVHYCASCDGMMYKGKAVAVIGGGNSAVADALILSKIAGTVHIIHRHDSLKATKIYHAPLMQMHNVRFHWNSTVTKLLHSDHLTGLKIKNTETGKEEKINCDGVFVNIGRIPLTQLFKDGPELDEMGYIKADESTRTNIPGVFAVGDVRTKALRQIITAAADGAISAHYAEEYLTRLNSGSENNRSLP